MAANQRECLNRGLSLNLWLLRSANHVKCTCDVYGEAYLKKYVYKLAKYGFATMRLNQKDSSWHGTHTNS